MCVPLANVKCAVTVALTPQRAANTSLALGARRCVFRFTAWCTRHESVQRAFTCRPLSQHSLNPAIGSDYNTQTYIYS
jgi:hypothetical protein